MTNSMTYNSILLTNPVIPPTDMPIPVVNKPSEMCWHYSGRGITYRVARNDENVWKYLKPANTMISGKTISGYNDDDEGS